MTEQEQSLASARLACEWLKSGLLEGNRSVLEEIVVDPGNTVRRVTYIDQTIRHIVSCLCCEFLRLDSEAHTRPIEPETPATKKPATGLEKPKPTIKKRGKK